MTSKHWLCKDRRYTCPHINLAAVSGAWLPTLRANDVADRLFSARLDIYLHCLVEALDEQ